MATQPKVESSGGLEDIISLFAHVNTIFGSGKTTSKESGGTSTQSSSLSSGSEADSNALLQKIFGDASGSNIDNIINDIFLKARDAMGPNIMSSLGAGNRAMSDTSLALIQSQAVARATADAAKAKLDAINTANATASKLVEAKMDSTKTTTITRPDVSKSTVTGASPSGKGLAVLGTASTASKGLGKLGDLVKGLKLGKQAKSAMDSRSENELSDEYTKQITDAYNSGDQASYENDIPLDAFGPGGTDAPAINASAAQDFGNEAPLTEEAAALQNAMTDIIPDPLSEQSAAALNEAFGPNSDAAANTAALSSVQEIDPAVMASLQSQGVTPEMIARATANAEAEGGNISAVYDENGQVTGFVNKDTGEPIDFSGGDTATTSESANVGGEEVISGGEGSTSLIGDVSVDSTLVGEGGSAVATGEGVDLAATEAAGAGAGMGTVALPLAIMDAFTEGGISQGALELTGESTDSKLSAFMNAREASDPGSMIVSNEDLGLDENTFEHGTESTEDVINSVSDLFENVSIICTELHKQGKLPRKFYVPSAIIFKNYDARGKQGYYIWAKPVVKYLRKDPNSFYSRIISKTFNLRNEYLAGVCGVSKARKLISGFIIDKLMYGFCWTLSRTICRG
jgi:hypothetical protein